LFLSPSYGQTWRANLVNAEYTNQEALEQAVSAWGQSRSRLFSVYAWTFCGLAATALLTAAILYFTKNQGLPLPTGGLGASVTIAAILFLVVMKVSSQLNPNDEGTAYFLLCLVPVSNALLACTFPGLITNMFGSEDMSLQKETIKLLATVYFVVSSAVIIILPINILIGFGSTEQGIFRWIVNIAIITIPIIALQGPESWWIGLVGGFLFAHIVSAAFKIATNNPQIPSPALAACLVAGVGFVVLLIVYLIIRFTLRTLAAITAAASR